MIILDTHAFLWFLTDSPELSTAASRLIGRTEKVAISIVSLWEIALKKSIGKLDIEQSISELEQFCNEKRIQILPIAVSDLELISSLPPIHKDPFDRLIVCQALRNGAIVVTRDSNISRYPARTIW